MPRMEKIGKIDETRTLRCAQRGGGLYLFLPKDLVQIYDLMGGDRIQVKLGEIYRQPKDEQEGDKNEGDN